jgi:hypothetical protein
MPLVRDEQPVLSARFTETDISCQKTICGRRPVTAVFFFSRRATHHALAGTHLTVS